MKRSHRSNGRRTSSGTGSCRRGVDRRFRREVITLEKLARAPGDVAALLFAQGYSRYSEGDTDGAQEWFHRVIHFLERWRVEGPGDGRDSIVARIALKHGAKLIKLREFQSAQAALAAAVHYGEQALQNSASSPLMEVLAASQGWRALAQRFVGNHEAAKLSYERSSGIWRMLIVFARNRSERNNYRRALAAVLFGSAKNLRLLGKHAEADQAREESNDLFKKVRQQ